MTTGIQIKSISPGIVRTMLAAAALFSLSFVVYASLVPLKYTPLPFDETVAEFQKTPWLDLEIDRRADWVANGLILVPAGFLAAGAIDWRRKRRWPLLLASPFIITLLVATVFGIEFVQIWFPPRVVSQNDIFAGVIGSVGGVLLWWLAGRYVLGQLEEFVLTEPGLKKWKLLMNFGVVGLLIYNIMPLDMLVSLAELQDKWNDGDILLVPFQDFQPNRQSILLLVIAAARVMPYVFVTVLHGGVRRAVLEGLVLALLMEIVKVPFHSRPATVSDVIASGLGVLLVAFTATMFMRWLMILDQGVVWCIGALGWTGVMLVGFLSRFDSIERTPAVLEQRLREIWVVPFVRAHRSSEFEAGENILVKLAVFGALTFLLSGWCSRLRTKLKMRMAAAVSVFGCILLGLGIELAQVFLPPLVPDATDFILYGVGALLGVMGFRVMIPRPTEQVSWVATRNP